MVRLHGKWTLKRMTVKHVLWICQWDTGSTKKIHSPNNGGKGKNTTHLNIFTSTYQERSTVRRFLWKNFMDLEGIWNGSILVLARFSYALSSKSQTHKLNIMMWTLNFFFPIFPPQSIPYSFESLNEREKQKRRGHPTYFKTNSMKDCTQVLKFI